MPADPATAVRQVLSFLDAGALITSTGRKIATRIDTFCAHGDEPSGVDVMSAVRQALEQRGVRVVTLPELEL